MSNNISNLYSRILKDIKNMKKPLVIGINGAYTSGKTVFAEGFQQYLNGLGIKTQLIHYDDFHNPFNTIHFTDETEIDTFYNHAFNSKKLIDEILDPLKSQGFLDKKIACVNLGTGEYTNNIHFKIDENTVVLLEGVLILRPPVIDYLDYKIYLDISSDEILRRGEMRDVPKFGAHILEKFVTRYIPVQEKYMAEHNPKKAADIVIDNNDYGAPKILCYDY